MEFGSRASSIDQQSQGAPFALWRLTAFCLINMTRVSQGTPLHGGLQGQKHHIIPARGNFLSSREENVPDSVFRDSIVEPSMCGPQPEQNGTLMGERIRPPATATDIKGILPTCGIKPVGDGTVRLKLIVEDATWPEYALFDSRSWSSHQRHLEPDASRPGIRFVSFCFVLSQHMRVCQRHHHDWQQTCCFSLLPPC